MARSVVFFPVVIVLCAGCLHSSQLTWRIDNPDTMRTALRQHVPPGTPLKVAKEFMEREGFSCTFERRRTFHERRGLEEWGPKHESIDFLDCTRSQSAGFLGSRCWSAALVVKDGVVSDVLVGHYIVYGL